MTDLATAIARERQREAEATARADRLAHHLAQIENGTLGASADGGYLPSAPVPVDAPAEHNALVLGLLQLRPPGGGW